VKEKNTWAPAQAIPKSNKKIEDLCSSESH
jgi:hypothetical protein